MPPRIRKLLLDISLACEEIKLFRANKTFEAFQHDRMLQLALEREYEIIGEALSRLESIDETLLAEHIPAYRKIIGLRNIIAHGYDELDDAMLWDFAQRRVDELLNKVQNW